jgi:hypothetical protein
MGSGRARRQWLIVALSIVMLMIPLALAYGLWAEIYQNPLVAELDAAQRRWSSRPFDHYRMIVDREQLRRRCHQYVEVRDEQIVSVMQDSCATGPLSVSGIFDQLRQSLLPPECVDDTCKCRITYRISIIYDSELGYPSMALLAPNRFRSELVDIDVWGLAPPISRRLDCPPVMPAGYETISIRELTPLP